MNQFQLSNTLSERLLSLQQQQGTGITAEQQEQLNAFMGGLIDNDVKTFGAQGEDTFDDRNHQDNQIDIAPLPLNASHFTGLTSGGIDRQALDELYKSLSHGEAQFDNNNNNNGTFSMSNANVNFGNTIRPMTMYSVSTPSFAFPTQFQNQLVYQHQNQNSNMSLQNQGGIIFPSFTQDGASASQLSSEALMNTLFQSNLSVLNHLNMKNTSNVQPMPLVHRPVEIEPVAKPVKALSAYNFFFRDQRDNILHGVEEDYSTEKQEELLAGHWFRDRTKKRRHRKTHGKIAFTDLSRMVSKRWKELPEEKKAFYKETAAKDLERYRREIHDMEKKQESSAYASLQTPSVVIARTA